jgi:hypothetical protein
LDGIHVSGPVECQLKMKNIQGDQAPAKRQKMLKTSENSSTKTVAGTIHELTDTIGISYGICQEILTENLTTYPITQENKVLELNTINEILANNNYRQRINSTAVNQHSSTKNSCNEKIKK